MHRKCSDCHPSEYYSGLVPLGRPWFKLLKNCLYVVGAPALGHIWKCLIERLVSGRSMCTVPTSRVLQA